ncbi:MAG: hypothetical protein U5K27_09770 [Desulfotignum sp.]|nr:hypothetical protein [Desulfotignum sp.]
MTLSGRQIPEVAPASTAILDRVMRPSMVMASTTGPANSMTWLVAPLTLI